VKEGEEAKRRILEEDPDISKDTLEFVLSLPVERKIPQSKNFSRNGDRSTRMKTT
jgi:hypothetical protein